MLKCLRLCGSDYLGERGSAALRAHEIVRRAGTDWDTLLVEPIDDDDDSDRTLFSIALAGRAVLTGWERDEFLPGIAAKVFTGDPLSPKQRALLEKLALKARVAEAVAA